MRKEEVEIYSDNTNSAIIRHPGRHFPGVLIQGDNLYQLCHAADEICAKGKDALDAETFQKLNQLRNSLWGHLTNYKAVLVEHGIRIPFSET